MQGQGRRILRAAGILLIAVGVGACASTPEGGDGNTTVVVENNLIPSTSLSIYAVPDVGARSLVGVVDPDDTATLRFDQFSSGSYQFVAETTAGREIVSNPLTFSPGATIRWDVNANIATVSSSG